MLYKVAVSQNIAPKLFYGEIEILQTKLCDNLADLFTNSLSSSLFQIYDFGIGIRRIKDLQVSGGVINP